VWELKYFDKISAYEKAEAAADAPPLPAFKIEAFGIDSNFKRGQRELTRRLFLIVFRLLRAFFPVLRIGRLVIVSRYKDVVDVLNRPGDFPVPYGREMTSIIDGANFALGMDGPDHAKQRAVILSWSSARIPRASSLTRGWSRRTSSNGRAAASTSCATCWHAR
jgi:hypothetical protein